MGSSYHFYHEMSYLRMIGYTLWIDPVAAGRACRNDPDQLAQALRCESGAWCSGVRLLGLVGEPLVGWM